MPAEDPGRRALAGCGVLFALAQTKAELQLTPADLQVDSGGAQLALADDAAFRRLVSDTAWAKDFTPFATEIRDAVFGMKATTTARLGVVDSDHFVALVNPHRLPSASLIREVSSLIGNWIRKALAVNTVTDEDDGVAEPGPDMSSLADAAEGSSNRMLKILAEALENCVQHAWIDATPKRSLITVEKVRAASERFLRLQVLDNGIGIPASLADKRGETVSSSAEAETLVESATVPHGSGLPGGRGRGLPNMRALAADLGGNLSLATCGPDDTQVVLQCKADNSALPYSDKLPVAGTIVTLRVPLDSLAADA